MAIFTTIMGLLGASTAIRGMYAGSHLIKPGFWQTLTKSPLIQGGTFGVGYTGGAYLGYGGTNTADPLGVHKPKYRPNKQSLGLPYGRYSYGRRRYARYSRYTRYRRRPYYRRRSYY